MCVCVCPKYAEHRFSPESLLRPLQNYSNDGPDFPGALGHSPRENSFQKKGAEHRSLWFKVAGLRKPVSVSDLGLSHFLAI